MKKHSGKLHFLSVRRKILIVIVLTSVCITTVLTAVSYYINYRSEIEKRNITLGQIESITVKSFNKALWHLDNKLIKTLIDGLLKEHDIVHVEVRDEKGLLIHFAEVKLGRKETREVLRSLRIVNYSLIHTTKDGEERLGTLSVHMTNHYLYSRLLKRMMAFFFTQGVKTLIISLMILFILNFYVIRHLSKIAHFLRQDIRGDCELPPLKLKRKSNKKEDEFDILVNSLNEMTEVVNNKSTQLKKEIEDRDQILSQAAHFIGLGELAGNIGHEINNPLMIIHGYIKKIQKYSATRDDPKDRETLIHFGNKVLEAVDRITTIAKRLRNFANINTREKIKTQEVGLLMEEFRALAEEKLKENNISFRVEFYHLDASFCFPYRRNQVAQILMNIFNYAYFEISNIENSWVHFEVTKDDQFLYLSVVSSEEAGLGKINSKFFDPSFSVRPSGDRLYIDMSLARNIMSQHDGEIYFDESSPYTKITLKFPLGEIN